METASHKSYFSNISIFKKKDPGHIGGERVVVEHTVISEHTNHKGGEKTREAKKGDEKERLNANISIKDKTENGESVESGASEHGDDETRQIANDIIGDVMAQVETCADSTSDSVKDKKKQNKHNAKAKTGKAKANKAKDSKLEGEKTTKQSEGASFLSKIKYSFISKETEAAFAEIGILFDKLFDDFPYNKVDLMFGLLMVDDYYKNAPVLSHQRVEDINFVETARYYIRFAYCCYGWKFIYGILNKKTTKFVMSMVGDAANLKALHDCTNVDVKDVILAKWTSTLYDPGHYICLCRERQTIVVAFRGTFHIRDCLTDLVATNTPFMEGTAHTGFVRTAKNKFAALAPIILKCYEENPTYKIVVVGHSLGAGTASLFTLLFHNAHPDVPIHCYAYAPPCVLSPVVALSPVTRNLIDSIVVGDDIVPRLSFATLNHLKHIIMDILAQSNNTFQRAFHWMSAAMGDGLKNALAGKLKVTPTPVIQPKKIGLSDISVFPAGRIFHLVPGSPVDVLDPSDFPSVTSPLPTPSLLSPSPPTPSPSTPLPPPPTLSDVLSLPLSEASIASDTLSVSTLSIASPTLSLASPPTSPADSSHATSDSSQSASDSSHSTSDHLPSTIISFAVSDTSGLPTSPSSTFAPFSPASPPASLSSASSPTTSPITSPASTSPRSTSPIPIVTSPISSSPPPSSVTSPISTSPPSSFTSPISSSPPPSSVTSPSSSIASPPSSSALKKPLKGKPKPPKKAKVYYMEYSNAALFNEIIISPNMFGVHMPSYYDKALERCLAHMKRMQVLNPQEPQK